MKDNHQDANGAGDKMPAEPARCVLESGNRRRYATVRNGIQILDVVMRRLTRVSRFLFVPPNFSGHEKHFFGRIPV